ncbi:MAG: nucleoside deaminase [Deltaproteobacteria bacterium]|nr:nucleoside deaminase [Deltaproteobacteria bacterium]
MKTHTHNQDEHFMQLALAQAKMAGAQNEIPIGAVLVKDNQVLASAHNSCEADHTPLSHAEIKVIQSITRGQSNWRLNEHSLYVTLEPCLMCLGAILQARVSRLVFGAYDQKKKELVADRSGIVGLNDQQILHDNNHALSVTAGVLEEPCSALLKDFFKKRRQSQDQS